MKLFTAPRYIRDEAEAMLWANIPTRNVAQRLCEKHGFQISLSQRNLPMCIITISRCIPLDPRPSICNN